MGFKETRGMPLRSFWFMCRQIDRLKAEGDLRALSVAEAAASVAMGGSEHAENVRKKLLRELNFDHPEQSVTDRLDREGFEDLRRMQWL